MTSTDLTTTSSAAELDALCINTLRFLSVGVREHAMGAILNGLAAHGGIIPFGATFLIFSDYMRPSMRLAALMGLHVIYVFTHDSIALGQDGPTHPRIGAIVKYWNRMPNK